MKTFLTILLVLIALAFLIMAGVSDSTAVRLTYFLLSVCAILCVFGIHNKSFAR